MNSQPDVKHGASVLILGHKCYRCNHEWRPYELAEVPRVCPKCKNPYWDRPRKTEVDMSDVLPMTETKTIECIEGFEEVCAKCGGDVEWTDCWNCGGNGIDGHECGEDTCCCLDPEDNVRCNTCEGKGSWATCPGCDK